MRRFRRLRQTKEMRSFVRENEVNVKDLIYPLFVVEGNNLMKFHLCLGFFSIH